MLGSRCPAAAALGSTPAILSHPASANTIANAPIMRPTPNPRKRGTTISLHHKNAGAFPPRHSLRGYCFNQQLGMLQSMPIATHTPMQAALHTADTAAGAAA
ncbi:MAG: hypothetical protein C0499_11995 [Zymomonas sp.]|nr:hypothetical protein [Zymomonas sp.]